MQPLVLDVGVYGPTGSMFDVQGFAIDKAEENLGYSGPPNDAPQ